MPKKTKLKSLFVLITLFFQLYAEIPPGYYDPAIGKTGEELKSALNVIINNGITRVSYGDSRYILDETDRDPANPHNLILVYLGTSVSGAWDGGITWNREHIWPQSLLNVSVDNNSINVGSDLHNLKPADPNENSSRGNKYFANQTTSESYAPRPAVRGDIARILFYMVVMYETPPLDLELVNRTPNVYEMGLLNALLEWHVQDPVDDYERNRNEVIYSYQHNRNPFIDHPEFVGLIWSGVSTPAAPSQLTATDITSSTLTLSWIDNSDDELGFHIYQCDSLIATTPANITQYTVENLTPGRQYNFTITAFNYYGESQGVTLAVQTLNPNQLQYPLFFSEYIEGSSYNKALEIVNASAAPVLLDTFCILSSTNNARWSTAVYKFPQGRLLEPGQVYVIAHANADTAITRKAHELLTTTVVNFNGDDVRALAQIKGADTTIIDVIGRYLDPNWSSNGWAVAGVSGATKDHTLVRKPEIRKGNPDWSAAAGTNINDSEWQVYEMNTCAYLGSHTFSGVATREMFTSSALDFRLSYNYPNPFNNTTHLVFALPETQEVALQVYDLAGHLIETVYFGCLVAGNHNIQWSAKQLDSGVYLYRLTAGQKVITGKFALLK